MKKLRSDILKYYVYRSLVKRFFLPILVLFMVDRGLTVEQIAIIAGLSYAVNIVLEVPSGAVADTLGHKRTLVIAELAMAASIALYLFGTFEWILLGNVLFFAAWSFASGTDSAILFERLKELGREKDYMKYLGRAKGIARYVGVATMVIASPLYLVAWWIPFVIGIVQFFFAGVIIGQFTAATRSVSVRKREGWSELVRHIPRATRTLRAHPRLLWTVLTGGVIFGAFVGVSEFYQVILDNAGFAVALFGTVYAIKRIFGATISFFADRIVRNISVPHFLYLSGALTVLHMALVPFVHNPYWLAGVILIPALFTVLISLSVNEYTNQSVPSESRATILSLSTFISSITIIATIALFGILSHFIVVEYGYGVVAALLALFLIVALPFVVRAQKGST